MWFFGADDANAVVVVVAADKCAGNWADCVATTETPVPLTGAVVVSVDVGMGTP